MDSSFDDKFEVFWKLFDESPYDISDPFMKTFFSNTLKTVNIPIQSELEFKELSDLLENGPYDLSGLITYIKTPLEQSGLKLTTNSPNTIDNYIIIKELGSGSYGTVSLAKNIDTDSHFVLKKIPKVKMSKNQVMEEVDSLIRLKPHCQEYMLCYERFFEDTNNYYIVTENLENYITLREMIHLPTTDQKRKNITRVTAKLIEGLAFLHSLGAAHRDIKPDNIMVSQDYQNIKYIDFGLSCFEDKCTTSSVTGTYIYMAPEIVDGRIATFNLNDLQKSDIWSLGATLFELNTCNGRFYNFIVSKMFDCDEQRKSNSKSSTFKKVKFYSNVLPKYLPFVLQTYVPSEFSKFLSFDPSQRLLKF
jgi:serine/threonine protein kinase